MATQTKKIVLPMLILAASAAVTFLVVRSRSPVERVEVEPLPPLVRVQAARVTEEQLQVRSRGEVRPTRAATLVVEVPGKVLWVAPNFQAGGFFKAGAPLLRLDRANYELALTRAKAEEARSNVRLTQAKAEAEIAIKEWADLGQGEAPPLARREPQVQEAEATLLAAQATRREAELNLRRTEIRAPYDGRIRNKLADLGQFLAAGQGVASFYGIGAAQVRLSVLDRDLALLDLSLASAIVEGPPVELSASFAGRQRRWSGRIVRTEGEIDPSTRMVALVAEVEDPYGRGAEEAAAPLAVGLFVDAVIRGIAEEVVRLPREALRRGPDGSDQVLIVDERERLRFRDVAVLQRTDREILVGSGISDGEVICISPLEAPEDGMTVRTVPAEETAEETAEAAS